MRGAAAGAGADAEEPIVALAGTSPVSRGRQRAAPARAVEVGADGESRPPPRRRSRRAEAAAPAAVDALGAWIEAVKMSKYAAAIRARVDELDDLKELTDADVARRSRAEIQISTVPLRRFKTALVELGADVSLEPRARRPRS